MELSRVVKRPLNKHLPTWVALDVFGSHTRVPIDINTKIIKTTSHTRNSTVFLLNKVDEMFQKVSGFKLFTLADPLRYSVLGVVLFICLDKQTIVAADWLMTSWKVYLLCLTMAGKHLTILVICVWINEPLYNLFSGKEALKIV